MYRFTSILLLTFSFSIILYSQEVESNKKKSNNIQGIDKIDVPQAATEEIKFKNETGNSIITITDEGSNVGSITLPSGSEPASPGSKLYNVGGELHFNGSTLGTTSTGGGWVKSGAKVSLATQTDFVGIGNSNPSVNLDITSSAANYASRIRLSNSDKTHNLYFFGGHSTELPYISFADGDALRFAKYDGSVNELMRITSDSKVGIGTSNPISKLSVGGNGFANATIYGETNEMEGIGVYGYATYTDFVMNYGGYFVSNGHNGSGVYGLSNGLVGYGVFGKAFNGTGIFGESIKKGVKGDATGNTGIGVSGAGTSNATDAQNYGGYFSAAGGNGKGIFALASHSGDVTNIGGNFAAYGTYGIGVWGAALSDGNGVNYGGRFEAKARYGRGVYGLAPGEDGKAIWGEALNSGSVQNYGGHFQASGLHGRGVYGIASHFGSSTSNNYGGYFESNGVYGVGVYGYSIGQYGNGVSGFAVGKDATAIYGNTSGISGKAIRGTASATGTTVKNYGGFFEAYGNNGRGIYSWAPNTGYAGYFQGNVYVEGNITKTGGAFKIDHPLDPTNKNLYHSFVESPDMMNIYNGNVMLDADGEAIVELADWFEALNMEFRYQLTAIGSPGPNLYISEEISGNQFRIAGGESGMKVSWQVTGIRHDAYANKNRIQVEEFKKENERGKYLHPEVFNMPKTSAVSYDENLEQERIRIQEQLKAEEIRRDRNEIERR